MVQARGGYTCTITAATAAAEVEWPRNMEGGETGSSTYYKCGQAAGACGCIKPQ